MHLKTLLLSWRHLLGKRRTVPKRLLWIVLINMESSPEELTREQHQRNVFELSRSLYTTSRSISSLSLPAASVHYLLPFWSLDFISPSIRQDQKAEHRELAAKSFSASSPSVLKRDLGACDLIFVRSYIPSYYPDYDHYSTSRLLQQCRRQHDHERYRRSYTDGLPRFASRSTHRHLSYSIQE